MLRTPFLDAKLPTYILLKLMYVDMPLSAVAWYRLEHPLLKKYITIEREVYSSNHDKYKEHCSYKNHDLPISSIDCVAQNNIVIEPVPRSIRNKYKIFIESIHVYVTYNDTGENGWK